MQPFGLPQLGRHTMFVHAALSPQFSKQPHDVEQSTVPLHAPDALQPTVHEPGPHVIAFEHELLPSQRMSQTAAEQVIVPEHELLPKHTITQLYARLQSSADVQLSEPQSNAQSISAGHVSFVSQTLVTQSNRHTSLKQTPPAAAQALISQPRLPIGPSPRASPVLVAPSPVVVVESRAGVSKLTRPHATSNSTTTTRSTAQSYYR